MSPLRGYQKKYLRGLAHNMKPVVLVGQKGLTDDLVQAAEEALETHELLKIKFNDFKDKDQKREISENVCNRVGAEICGIIGHTVILYKEQRDPEKRKISLPQR